MDLRPPALISHTPVALQGKTVWNGGSVSTAAPGSGTGRTVIDGNGIHIEDSTGKIRIDEDPLAQLIQIFDDNAIARALMGHLPTNGISPAQWGFRASDASGNPIFDSLGLIKAMSVLGSAFYAGPVGPAGSSGNYKIPPTSSALTFSLSRQVTVYLLGTINGYVTDTALGYGSNIFFQIQGQSQSGNGALPIGVAGSVPQSTCTVYQVISLPAGSYNVDFWVYLATGQELFTQGGCQLYVFQLGS